MFYRAVVKNGGAIIQEPYPEGDLWVATFADPGSNRVGVWQRGALDADN